MIGIIYKFTILTNNRFYVGQHVTTSVNKFLKKELSSYWGSGNIWGDCLKALKFNNPNWMYLVKREVLCYITVDNPILLNKLEEYWINKLDANYKLKKGGCNILLGAAYGVDWINAMKDPEIRKKVSDKNRVSLKGLLSGIKHPLYGKKRSEETRRKISETRKQRIKLRLINPYENVKKATQAVLGTHKTPEHRKKIGDSQRGEKSVHWGKKLSNEHKEKMSKSLKEYFKINGCSNTGMKHITNGVVNKWHNPKLPLPKGWRYGRTLKNNINMEDIKQKAHEDELNKAHEEIHSTTKEKVPSPKELQEKDD